MHWTRGVRNLENFFGNIRIVIFYQITLNWQKIRKIVFRDVEEEFYRYRWYSNFLPDYTRFTKVIETIEESSSRSFFSKTRSNFSQNQHRILSRSKRNYLPSSASIVTLPLSSFLHNSLVTRYRLPLPLPITLLSQKWRKPALHLTQTAKFQVVLCQKIHIIQT